MRPKVKIISEPVYFLSTICMLQISLKRTPYKAANIRYLKQCLLFFESIKWHKVFVTVLQIELYQIISYTYANAFSKKRFIACKNSKFLLNTVLLTTFETFMSDDCLLWLFL